MSLPASGTLLTWRFAALNAAYFSLCCSLAAFFGLQLHLESLGFERWQIDVLLGSLGLGGLLARPFIAPHLHSMRSCLVCLAVSGTAMAAALAAYLPSSAFYALLAARLVNGFAFGGVFCALVALSPHAFPASRGGAAFSALSISCLGPFIMLPPLLPSLSSAFGGYAWALASSSLPLLVCAPLVWIAFSKRPSNGSSEGESSSAEAASPPCLKELLSGLLSPFMLALLFATFSFYYSYAWVFYHSDAICKAAGVSNPGLLMSVAICCSIVFRLALSKLFDGSRRASLLIASLALNALAVLAIWGLRLPPWSFLAVFLGLGLAWGVAVPLLSSAMMEGSEGRAQGFNLNMSSQMQDMGYFLGPMLGGALGSGALVALAGGFALAVALSRRKGFQSFS